MVPPTILQILPRLVTGGVERGTVETVAALTKAGWKALVASEGGAMVHEVEAAGGTHITLPLASKNPFTIWRNADALAAIIRQYKVDIVHVRSRAPAWSTYFAAQRTGCHFITTFHNAYGATNALKRTYNAVMAKGERVIAISEFVADYARRVYAVTDNILRVIPRGVDIDRFDRAKVTPEQIHNLRRTWTITPDKPVILLPGRLTRWKGQTVFIEALTRMSHRNFQAVIVGSGSADYRDEIQNLIAQHQLNDCVKIVDECRDMPAAFALSQLTVSASTRPEGFGRVIVEAQAMGCAVIATNHGGACETVKDSETGWLVTPVDSAALAAAISRFLEMPSEDRTRISVNAAAYVRKNFTTALMTERTMRVYQEVLR